MDVKNKILLIEDNKAILEANRRILIRSGYDIYSAETLSEAEDVLMEVSPNLIILDVILPDGSGLDFIKVIREKTTAPILLLTALTDKDNRIKGLRAGGDDYITKPYDLDELRERVAAFLRRDAMLFRPNKDNTISLGNLTLNMTARRAYLNEEDIMLNNREFDLLSLFIKEKGKPLSKQLIYEKIWAMNPDNAGGVVWSQISRLKKKLEKCGDKIKITSIYGQGYKLDVFE